MDMLFTNRKLPSIHSESVPRSGSKARTYNYAGKKEFEHFTDLEKDSLENISQQFSSRSAMFVVCKYFQFGEQGVSGSNYLLGEFISED